MRRGKSSDETQLPLLLQINKISLDLSSIALTHHKRYPTSFPSLLTIIFLIAEIDGAPAMCLSGAVIDILVLIFMKIADKKGYIYIPNYSL